jgi:hypothetical protein
LHHFLNFGDASFKCACLVEAGHDEREFWRHCPRGSPSFFGEVQAFELRSLVGWLIADDGVCVVAEEVRG